MASAPLVNRSRSPTPETSAAEVHSLLEASGLILGHSNQGHGNTSTAEIQLEEARERELEQQQEEARLQWHDQLRRWQSRATILSHFLCLLAALLVMTWVHQLGGLSWKEGQSKQVFNWHPLLMILAYCFMTVAALSFRAPPYHGCSRNTIKLVHGSAWTIAAIFGMIALIAVFKSHNDSVSGFVANLYSFHSWLGLGVVGLYVLQFLAGFFTFAWPLSFVTPLVKAQVLSVHSFLGPFLHMAVSAVILLGIQEKEGFVGCGYKVEQADYFPLSHLTLIPPACLVSHGIGIAVFATALLTSFALHDFRR